MLCAYNVLLAINNRKRSICIPPSNITSVEPSIGLQVLSSLFWIFVITNEHIGTTETDFTTWEGVSGIVVHFWHVNKLHLFNKQLNWIANVYERLI